jgi:hypothetical protein
VARGAREGTPAGAILAAAGFEEAAVTDRRQSPLRQVAGRNPRTFVGERETVAGKLSYSFPRKAQIVDQADPKFARFVKAKEHLA